MTAYRKKPVEIEAMHWDGTDARSREIRDWAENAVGVIDTDHIRHLWDYDAGAYIMPRGKVIFGAPFKERCLIIATLEGEMVARRGDWIIRGVQGEFYPCKPDIFEATYELVESPELSPAELAKVTVFGLHQPEDADHA
jgi:hypothetical protein